MPKQSHEVMVYSCLTLVLKLVFGSGSMLSGQNSCHGSRRNWLQTPRMTRKPMVGKSPVTAAVGLASQTYKICELGV